MPVALALILAGCGSSSSGSSSASSTSSSSASASSGGYGQPSTSAASNTAPAALITTKHASKLGTILAFGPKRLTVYLFEGDKPGSSRCTGACAGVWPPVTGTPKAVGGALSTDLGTITRPGGIKQVTYKGHPLYLFVRDKDDGDAYGEGIKEFGAEWYALNPTGSKVDLS
jgi:predicted lipoprotein with Yx(FWY)xxD motif